MELRETAESRDISLDIIDLFQSSIINLKKKKID